MGIPAVEPRCEGAECPSPPLLDARHCWIHLPDREAWRVRQERAAMAGEDLARCNFRRADLSGLDFAGAMLPEAHFDGATLRGAVFTRSLLYAARLVDANAGRAGPGGPC